MSDGKQRLGCLGVVVMTAWPIVASEIPSQNGAGDVQESNPHGRDSIGQQYGVMRYESAARTEWRTKGVVQWTELSAISFGPGVEWGRPKNRILAEAGFQGSEGKRG